MISSPTTVIKLLKAVNGNCEMFPSIKIVQANNPLTSCIIEQLLNVPLPFINCQCLGFVQYVHISDNVIIEVSLKQMKTCTIIQSSSRGEQFIYFIQIIEKIRDLLFQERIQHTKLRTSDDIKSNKSKNKDIYYFLGSTRSGLQKVLQLGRMPDFLKLQYQVQKTDPGR